MCAHAHVHMYNRKGGKGGWEEETRGRKKGWSYIERSRKTGRAGMQKVCRSQCIGFSVQLLPRASMTLIITYSKRIFTHSRLKQIQCINAYTVGQEIFAVNKFLRFSRLWSNREIKIREI